MSQQGRVTVEADANEAEEIRAGESRAQMIDIIGPSGSPDDGFKISIPAAPHLPFDFAIGAGTLYAGGVRVHNASAETYRGQRTREWSDYPAGRAAPEPTGASTEMIYLEVTETEVTAVEDGALREVALDGPDTAARTRMVQRVQRVPVQASSCMGALDHARKYAWADRTFEPATMELASNLQLKAGFTAGPTTADPCQPMAQAGFLGDENQLIRVQVATTATGAAMLWGYDNASFLYRVAIDTTAKAQVTFAAAPVDVFHRPRRDQWVEVLATAVALDGDAVIAAPVGQVVQVDDYDPTSRTLTLRAELDAGFFAMLPAPVFVRVWENLQPFAASETTATELVTVEQVGTGVHVWTRGGAPVAGDHWLIGVRPSVPDQIFPARLKESFQPPDGPTRWAVPLAVIAWADAQTGTVTDCRETFRNLTSDDDLAFHNKHLHGWGVVCGLQVQCMTKAYADAHALVRPHESVLVRDGYAIHPTGADIRLRSAAGDSFTAVALGDLGLKRTNGVLDNGAVSLWIDTQRAFHAETYDPARQKTWLERLDGTLLLDIYQDCVLKVVEYLKSQLIVPPGEGPAGPTARRFIALFNLFWQLVNPASGTKTYLSGLAADDVADSRDTEDSLLRAFYEGLKGLLQSKTFCAMFDDLPYPDYKVYRTDVPSAQPRPTTMFGAGFHQRMRIHPHRPLAYTFGSNGKINVFHLVRRELIAVVDFPVAGADIQDLAFALDSNEFYAIAWTGNSHVDSTFIVGTITFDEKLAWSSRVSELKGIKLCMLSLGDQKKDVVYAVARGVGIFQFTVVPTAVIPMPWGGPFRASGHLVAGQIGNETILYAGDNATVPHPLSFTRVVGFDVAKRNPRLLFALPRNGTSPGSGHDDLTVMPSTTDGVDDVYAIVDAPGAGYAKRLVAWDPTDGRAKYENNAPGGPHRNLVELGPCGLARVAYSASGQCAMITYRDTGLGRIYRRGLNVLEPHIHPLQVAPSAIVTNEQGGAFYVLEGASNTVTVIPSSPDDTSTINLVLLETYRRDAIAAFVTMIGRVVQYLKDCLCEHLLVNCPTDDGKVYLADISIQDGKIYQICNFHRRKYVHTFPTVEYWMSILPILPLLKEGVEKLCCSVVTGWFEKLIPGAKDSPGTPVGTPTGNSVDNTDTAKLALVDRISPTMMMNAATYVRAADVVGTYTILKSQVGLGAAMGKNSLAAKLRQPSAGNVAPTSSAPDVAMKSPDEARKLALERGITVRNVEVARDDLRGVFSMVTTVPASRGDTVDLVTDANGRVLGWKRATLAAPVDQPAASPPSSTLPPPATVPPPATAEVAILRRELEKMTAAHARQEASVVEMRKQLTELASHVETLRRGRPG